MLYSVREDSANLSLEYAYMKVFRALSVVPRTVIYRAIQCSKIRESSRQSPALQFARTLLQ